MPTPIKSQLFADVSPQAASQTQGGWYRQRAYGYDETFGFGRQASLQDDRADLNGDGDVSISELVLFNRDRRDA